MLDCHEGTIRVTEPHDHQDVYVFEGCGSKVVLSCGDEMHISHHLFASDTVHYSYECTDFKRTYCDSYLSSFQANLDISDRAMRRAERSAGLTEDTRGMGKVTAADLPEICR